MSALYCVALSLTVLLATAARAGTRVGTGLRKPVIIGPLEIARMQPTSPGTGTSNTNVADTKVLVTEKSTRTFPLTGLYCDVTDFEATRLHSTDDVEAHYDDKDDDDIYFVSIDREVANRAARTVVVDRQTYCFRRDRAKLDAANRSWTRCWTCNPERKLEQEEANRAVFATFEYIFVGTATVLISVSIAIIVLWVEKNVLALRRAARRVALDDETTK